MNFVINYDSGNIEQDIFDTINNYTSSELLNFINSIKFKRESGQIVGNSIVFRYPDCIETLASIKDISKVTIETRKFVKSRSYRLNFEELLLKYLNIKETKYPLIDRLSSKLEGQINIRKMFCDVIANEKYDSRFYEICFDIISSDEVFNKFIKYDNNKKLFGKYSKNEYVLEISKILGYQEFEICSSNPVYKYNLVDEDMKKRYFQLRDIVNVDLDMLGPDIFCQGDRTSFTSKKQFLIDNDWDASPEIINFVFKNINPKYNSLEKVAHIYIRLCQALRYNLGYHIKKWSTQYNKERQEGSTPSNNEIICSEFTYLATNLINKYV